MHLSLHKMFETHFLCECIYIILQNIKLSGIYLNASFMQISAPGKIVQSLHDFISMLMMDTCSVCEGNVLHRTWVTLAEICR